MSNVNTTEIYPDNTYKLNKAKSDRRVGRGSGWITETDTGYSSNYDDLLFVPNWTFEDFYKERTQFRTQGMENNTSGSYNDIGLFFYKVFFNFNTSYGLFGSLLSDKKDIFPIDKNSAVGYLANNIEGDKFSEKYKNVLRTKYKSLESFGAVLNYLQMECPWFFKSIENFGEVTKRNFSDIAPTKEKSITLVFNPDAVDMRISTLLDLYINACYDTINFREVIPENLRKFDMSIIMFNPPTRNLNIPYTPMTSSELNNAYDIALERTANQDGLLEGELDIKETDYSVNEHNWAGILKDRMSYRCVILKNCEIDFESLITTPDELVNADPFTLDNKINIKFQRSYVYNLNASLSMEVLDNMYNELLFDDLGEIIKKQKKEFTDTINAYSPGDVYYRMGDFVS